MACIITDLVVKLAADITPIPQANVRVRIYPTLTPIFVKTDGNFREIIDNADRILHTTSGGQYSVSLPWPSEQDPENAQWIIDLPDGTAWQGTIPEGVDGPLTLSTLKNIYGWGLSSPQPNHFIPIAIAGPPLFPPPIDPDDDGKIPVAFGGRYIPHSGSLDDWTAALVPTLEGVFSPTLELGQTLETPEFLASYNGVDITALTIDDGLGALPIALLSKFDFTYDGGASGLPSRNYVRSDIGAQVDWIISATRSTVFGLAIRTTIASCKWQPRVFFGNALPDTYDETFIEALFSRVQASLDDDYDFPAADAGEYSYLCWPTAFGDPISVVEQHFIDVPLQKVATGVVVTNIFGVDIIYDILKTVNSNASALTLTTRG